MKCGKGAFRSEKANPTENKEGTTTQVEPTVRSVAPAQQNLASSAEVPSGSYKWAIVYGWFVIIAAAYLLLSGALTLLGGLDVAPPPHAFAQKPIGAVGALFQELLWLAAGLAILLRKLIAIRLVWSVAILAGVEVLLRGIVPFDLLTWLLTVFIAKWFSSKRPFLSK